ncbi:MAG: tRNA-dihydrouridine synthase [Candidatus Pacebacteria bacterium]|nr:tRNA-dihydrouridine synthase [Candidatus Paceibacterota bacterium]MBP9840440.1 tRNA-dihydrouridine synthase [Candidatus Paceibacterota bacterium]
MDSFWSRLPRPFFVLAPMADVTDAAFRSLIAEKGAPHVTWTEFVSADGLYHTREPRSDGSVVYASDAENPLIRDLRFTEGERPIVAQLFSAKPEMMRYGAKLCAELGFDGIDINMGCPDKTIEKQGCGAAMIKDPALAASVLEAAREGAREGRAGGLPVSVKTRIGYSREDIDGWIRHAITMRPDALTVHLRTRKEMSLVPAHWELMPRIVALRDEIAPGMPIIGNGDAEDLDDARKKAEASGCDGVMLGRGIFGNPWLFSGRNLADIPLDERLAALVELAKRFETLAPRKSFHILKKHVKAFVKDFDGAAELRGKLMQTETAAELENVAGTL